MVSQLNNVRRGCARTGIWLFLGLGAACTTAQVPTAPSVNLPPAVAAAPVASPSSVTPPAAAPTAPTGTSAASVATLSITPTNIRGGRTATGTVTVSAPAPAGGTVVTLTSTDRDVRPPASITIPAGATTATFDVPTSEPHADTMVTITVSADGETRSVSILLLLDPPDGRSDSYTVPANGSIVVPAPGILANDLRRTGHDLTAVLLRRPQYGILDLERNGRFTYVAEQGVSGSDTFTYRPMDGDTRGNEVTVTLVVLPQPVAGPPPTHPVPAPTGSQTFSFTGAAQTFTVPAGVTQITIEAFGAEGGTALLANPGVGGLGGSVQATLSVTPGAIYQINVGGRGTNGTSGVGGGAAGGGASDVRTGANGLADRLIVAGGGGGGGGKGLAAVAGSGGSGGGLSGLAGGSTDQGAGGGGGGTQAAGGAGGGGGFTGTAGASALGGDGGSGSGGVAGGFNGGGLGGNTGGGGGGGLFGGGGGGVANSGGGGGGGSSFATGTATSVTHQQGVRSGNGSVVIRW